MGEKEGSFYHLHLASDFKTLEMIVFWHESIIIQILLFNNEVILKMCSKKLG